MKVEEYISEHIKMYRRIAEAIMKSGTCPSFVAVETVCEILVRLFLQIYEKERAPEMISERVNHWLLKVEKQKRKQKEMQ